MDEDNEKGVSIFGKKIAEIPCFRDSYFYGILSGLTGGIGYFMFTSKIRIATHFGMGTFCVSTLTYWGYCRWKFVEQIKETTTLKALLQEHISKEGTRNNSKNEDFMGTV